MKRLNPNNGLPLARGDKRSDGLIFKSYELTHIKQDGYAKEKWLLPEAFFRDCVRNKYRDSTRNRGRPQGFDDLENNISTDYLIEIFPDDQRCPVFGFIMEFGGHQDTSPSLDRVDPLIGYVRGNVVWISYLANRMKSNVSLQDLVILKKWARNLQDNEKKN